MMNTTKTVNHKRNERHVLERGQGPQEHQNEEAFGNELSVEQRNATFAEYERLIHFTVRRHMGMLEALQMEYEDMAQEMAICLLRAIESFDPTRNMKASTYYIGQLQYGILSLWRIHHREMRRANLNTSPLAYSNADGEIIERYLPFETDEAPLWVDDFMQTLSVRERSALMWRLHGDGLFNKQQRHQQRRYMSIVKQKAQRFIAAGGIM
jgi:DNA-directed RNA polymerase specialized sigma24 family protein